MAVAGGRKMYTSSKMNFDLSMFVAILAVLLPVGSLAAPAALQQPAASSPVSRPTRPLQWGDINILHTTDTHGWLAGHLKSEEPEPNYSGDWGDFQSFVHRMKAQARQRGVDLLLVDSGDHHDGNGLSDAEAKAFPGVVRGTTADQIFAQVPFDVLAIGNHEMYDFQVAKATYELFAPKWNGNFLTSNTNITLNNVSRPVGPLYRKFVTEQGRRVTSFGVLYRFRDSAQGLSIQPPADMVKEAWFRQAVAEAPDVFILAGHMAINDKDWRVVQDAIRVVHPAIPILILGGHLHIRDCRRFDDHSMALASGRYFETLGWLSMNFSTPYSPTPSFSRRYLDQNRNTYAFHAGTPNFDTPQGLATSRRILDASRAFNISYSFGTAPRSYFADRVSPDSQNSLLHLLSSSGGVLETVVRNKSRLNPPFVIINTGGVRADVYKGPFTVNDQYIAIPFENRFVYVADVPNVVAAKLLKLLEKSGAKLREEFGEGASVGMKPSQARRDDDIPFAAQYSAQTPFVMPSVGDADDLTYGYVTQDECGPNGDDVLHNALPNYTQPNYIGTPLPNTTTVDFVFFDFIKDKAVEALNKAQTARHYSVTGDVKEYIPLRANEMLGAYASKAWN